MEYHHSTSGSVPVLNYVRVGIHGHGYLGAVPFVRVTLVAIQIRVLQLIQPGNPSCRRLYGRVKIHALREQIIEHNRILARRSHFPRTHQVIRCFLVVNGVSVISCQIIGHQRTAVSLVIFYGRELVGRRLLIKLIQVRPGVGPLRELSVFCNPIQLPGCIFQALFF